MQHLVDTTFRRLRNLVVYDNWLKMCRNLVKKTTFTEKNVYMFFTSNYSLDSPSANTIHAHTSSCHFFVFRVLKALNLCHFFWPNYYQKMMAYPF